MLACDIEDLLRWRSECSGHTIFPCLFDMAAEGWLRRAACSQKIGLEFLVLKSSLDSSKTVAVRARELSGLDFGV